jgi:ectoine hydroxylase-related dioxygenase (phytanoyl-CoA dioxygenase family)
MAQLLGTPNVELHHTTLHCKPPETGMPFPMHQDSPFYRHEGPGYVDAIVHVDDATSENGCLRFLAGSHKQGHLEHVLQMPDGAPCSPHLPTDRYRLEDTVECPAKAGDVVAFSIYTIHGSEINRTDLAASREGRLPRSDEPADRRPVARASGPHRQRTASGGRARADLGHSLAAQGEAACGRPQRRAARTHNPHSGRERPTSETTPRSPGPPRSCPS